MELRMGDSHPPGFKREAPMPVPLSEELNWLTYTTLLTGLMWVPYILNRLREQGILEGFWDPQGLTDSRVGWAKRMMKAHTNAVENLVVFAPLAIMVAVTGSGNAVTAAAAEVYFFARLGHYLVFSLGVPLLRVLLFVVGVVAQLVLGLTLLGWL
jgi:uncharacterized MAPEG superfamily protein